MNDDQIQIGMCDGYGRQIPFGISLPDLRQHIYVIGKTGSGKTTLLRNMIIQHIARGHGVGLIDPHGDLAEDLLGHIPRWRTDHLVYFNPSDLEFPIALNLLANVPKDGRVVIPIHNVKGELVAYAGRWPGEPPEDAEKYKLPPKFKKMQELFNLDRAIKEPPDQPLVIVEGFFDVIKLHQHGYRKVVVLMGSYLSEAHVELIRQHTSSQSHVIVMLHEDKASAAGRDQVVTGLSKLCFVRAIQFAKPDTQPEHLSAEELADILDGAP